MVKSTQPRTASLIKRLTILYMSALGSIAVLTIFGQLVVQSAIIQLEGDSRIVNIAGRQRMLSQRLTRLSLELAHAMILPQSDASMQTQLIARLRTDLETWIQNHRGLQNGSEALQLPGKNSQSVQSLFNELTPHFEALRASFESEMVRFSSDQPEELETAIRSKISFHSDAFLVGMDKIVTLLEQEARDRVNRLRWIETALLMATISVLVCEGIFVFSPAVASLSRSLTTLQSTSHELERARDVAEKANRAKTDFLARVSHELRTPLHAILGMLGLVEQSKLRPDQRTKIRLANEASTSLLSLVDDLLDVAGIEQGREFVVHSQVVDFRGLLSSTFEVMSPLIVEKGLRFELNLQESLPNWVAIDADRVRQVLSNLLQNAIRYTNKGTVRCNATIQTKGTEEFLCLVVEDTGIGIPRIEQERIFECFNRGSIPESSPAFGRGLGMGLTITQAIVQRLGGTIVVSSEVGIGSRFTVTFPIQPTESSEPAGNRPTQNTISTPTFVKTANGLQPSALIVDDSPDNLLILRSYLRRLGYRTMSVSSLKESITKFRKHSFDIVLVDRNLADGDGLDFPRLLTDDYDLTSLGSSRLYLITADIHLTANSDPRLRPFARVLHKPISLPELRQVLATENPFKPPNATVCTDEKVGSFEQLKNKLAKGLIETLPSDIASLHGMLNRYDYTGLEFISHRLMGSAGNAGMDEVASLSREIHDAAALRHGPKIKLCLSKLANLSASLSSLFESDLSTRNCSATANKRSPHRH